MSVLSFSNAISFLQEFFMFIISNSWWICFLSVFGIVIFMPYLKERFKLKTYEPFPPKNDFKAVAPVVDVTKQILKSIINTEGIVEANKSVKGSTALTKPLQSIKEEIINILNPDSPGKSVKLSASMKTSLSELNCSIVTRAEINELCAYLRLRGIKCYYAREVSRNNEHLWWGPKRLMVKGNALVFKAYLYNDMTIDFSDISNIYRGQDSDEIIIEANNSYKLHLRINIKCKNNSNSTFQIIGKLSNIKYDDNTKKRRATMYHTSSGLKDSSAAQGPLPIDVIMLKFHALRKLLSTDPDFLLEEKYFGHEKVNNGNCCLPIY